MKTLVKTTMGFDDTLAKIAKRTGSTVQRIMQLNPDLKPTEIYIGKSIIIEVERNNENDSNH